MAAKVGLSDSLRRMKIEIASNPDDTRNGARQPPPHPALANAASPRVERTARITPSAPTSPKAAEACTQAVA